MLEAALRGGDRRCRLDAEIVAAAREMLRLGLVSGTSGNVSARVGELMRITPSRAAVHRDGPGRPGRRSRSTAPSSRASASRRASGGSTAAVYAARPDAGALVHTHSEHARPGASAASRSAAWTATAAVRAVGARPRSRGAAVAALGDRSAVLLAGHGVLALGDTPARRAGGRAVEVERAARDSVTHRTQAGPSARDPVVRARAPSRRSSRSSSGRSAGRQADAGGRAAAALRRERAQALPLPQAQLQPGRAAIPD